LSQFYLISVHKGQDSVTGLAWAETLYDPSTAKMKQSKTGTAKNTSLCKYSVYRLWQISMCSHKEGKRCVKPTSEGMGWERKCVWYPEGRKS
jgi:hypothetical protein